MISRVSGQLRRRRGEGEGGFTLVELLVVIVILAILAAIVVFAVGGITDHGQTSACKSDEQALATAEESYFAQNSAYTDMTGLVPKYLHASSTLHTVAVTGSGTGSSYTISAVSPCT